MMAIVSALGLLIGMASMYLILSIKYKQLSKEETKNRRRTEELYRKLKHDFERQRKELLRERQLLQKEKERVLRMEREYQDQLRLLEKRTHEYHRKLEEIANMDKEEIKQRMKEEINRELDAYKVRKLDTIREELAKDRDKLAQELLLEAMQNVDVDFVDEATVTRVKVPNPDLKGKIIGKDGRNIKAFEKAAGVDLIVDEQDDYVTISSYDPVRREIARIALERLMKDGRIHPAFIEEQVNRAKKELTKELLKDGRKLAEMAGLYRAPQDLLVLLGRLKFRRSGGQSLYNHTAEVVELSEQIGKKLNLDVKSLKLGALLHDVGKLLTSKINKPHHHISADIARKYGFDEKVVNIVEAHHDDIPAKYVECEVLKVADKISGLRPGARKDTTAEYVDRIKGLEEKALELARGRAEEIYALKAGRELRIVVKPHKVSDEEAALLAYDIAKGIEESGVFPGEVEVIVIREVRSYAKAAKPKGSRAENQNNNSKKKIKA